MTHALYIVIASACILMLAYRFYGIFFVSKVLAANDAEAFDEVRPYLGFLRTAGGVTVSGGEPLAQPAFVGALLRVLHDEHGIHTAIDTQGFPSRKLHDDWFDAVDLVLPDIKHIDPARYQSITGHALAPTLDFAARMVRLGKPMWIRHVLAPGLTDSPDDLSRLADYLAGLGPLVERVDLLPFHQLGAHKWKALGYPDPLARTPTPTPGQVATAIGILRNRELPVF